MRGRKPKPTALKVLADNPGKRPLNAAEVYPEVPKRAPPPPRHLTTEAKREWTRMVKRLMRMGLYTVLDRPLLMVHCQAYGYNVMADRKLQEMGLLGETLAGSVMRHPLWLVLKQTQEMMIKIAPEFGLSPSARSRLDVKQVEKEMSLADKLFSEAIKKSEEER